MSQQILKKKKSLKFQIQLNMMLHVSKSGCQKFWCHQMFSSVPSNHLICAIHVYTSHLGDSIRTPIDLIPGFKSFDLLCQVLIYLLVFKKLLWFRKWTNFSHSCSAGVYKQRRTFPPFPATTSFLTNTSRTYKFSKIHAWKLL